MIRALVLLCLTAAPVLGLFAPGLRVRFAFSCQSIGRTAFIDMPQSDTAAAAKGWVRRTRPEGPQDLTSLVMWCPCNDVTVCTLYDDTGYIAGLQVAFEENSSSNVVYDWSVQGFTYWTSDLNGTPMNYYTKTQYYISGDILKTDAATRIAARNTSQLLQNGALWVTGFNSELYEISANTTELTGPDSIFTKQQCIARMGYHYYYNMTADLECRDDTLFSWFPLVYNNQLIGIGVNLFAQFTVAKGSRDWFEYSGDVSVRYTVPNGPECLYDLAKEVGQVTQHVYFIDAPWEVTCMS